MTAVGLCTTSSSSSFFPYVDKSFCNKSVQRHGTVTHAVFTSRFECDNLTGNAKNINNKQRRGHVETKIVAGSSHLPKKDNGGYTQILLTRNSYRTKPNYENNMFIYRRYLQARDIIAEVSLLFRMTHTALINEKSHRFLLTRGVA